MSRNVLLLFQFLICTVFYCPQIILVILQKLKLIHLLTASFTIYSLSTLFSSPIGRRIDSASRALNVAPHFSITGQRFSSHGWYYVLKHCKVDLDLNTHDARASIAAWLFYEYIFTGVLVLGKLLHTIDSLTDASMSFSIQWKAAPIPVSFFEPSIYMFNVSGWSSFQFDQYSLLDMFNQIVLVQSIWEIISVVP